MPHSKNTPSPPTRQTVQILSRVTLRYTICTMHCITLTAFGPTLSLVTTAAYRLTAVLQSPKVIFDTCLYVSFWTTQHSSWTSQIITSWRFSPQHLCRWPARHVVLAPLSSAAKGEHVSVGHTPLITSKYLASIYLTCYFYLLNNMKPFLSYYCFNTLKTKQQISSNNPKITKYIQMYTNVNKERIDILLATWNK